MIATHYCGCCTPRRSTAAIAASILVLLAGNQIVAAETGLELSGRDGKDTPPDRWRLVDPASQKEGAGVRDKWGFVAAPPGEYELRLRPETANSVEVAWGRVKVPAEGRAKVAIRSGVEIAGR